MSLLPSAPVQSPLLQDLKRGLLSHVWIRWLVGIKDGIDSASQKVGNAVSLSGQGASIGATAIPTPTLTAGLYRVSYHARITRAATTTSSLTVTIGWTDGGVACSQAGAAMTGNTTATVQSGTVLMTIDNTTSVTYATTYASAGAVSMQYKLEVRLEKVP